MPTTNSFIKKENAHSGECEQRQIAERSNEISEIVSHCKDVPQDLAKRLITLDQLEKLVQSANPERMFNFSDRNFTETQDLDSFRQVLSDVLAVEPDLMTCFHT